MAIAVVRDGGRRYCLRRLGRSTVSFVGATLVVVGAVTTIPLCLIGATTQLSEDSPIVQLPGTGVSVGQAASIGFVTAVVGWFVGLRLARRRRRLVLFLRRFGYGEATRAVTFATHSLGGSWRMVTLDDAQIAPVGVAGTSSRAARAAAVGARSFNRFQQVAGKVWGTIMLTGFVGVALVVAFLYVTDPGGDLVGRVIGLLSSNEPVAWLFKIAAGLLVLGAALASLAMVIIQVGLILLPVFLFVSSLLQTVRDADATKVAHVNTTMEITYTAEQIEKQSRRFFSPRLVVLSVATEIWRETVLALSSRVAVAVVDVSEPTDQVLWEIEELRRRAARIVFVVHADRVGQLAIPLERPPRTYAQRLRSLLDGEVALAYTTDRAGLRSFTRLLRAALEQRRSLQP